MQNQPDNDIYREFIKGSMRQKDYPACGVTSFIRDMVESQKAGMVLRETREFSHIILEHSPNPIMVHNPDLSVRYVNPAFEKLTGFIAGELCQTKPPFPYWPAEMAESYLQIMQRRIENTSGQPLERFFRKKSGQSFWVELTTAAVEDQNGNPLFLVSIWLDMTERKRAEEQIRYQARLVDSVTDAIVSTDLESHILSWNKAAERIYGWNREEVIGRRIREVLQLEFPTGNVHELLQQLDKTGYWIGETLQKRRDGRVLNIGGSVSRINDSAGKAMGNVVIFHDITEIKQVHVALQESESKYRSLVNNVRTGIFRSTPGERGRFLEVNPAMEEITGYSREELLKMDVRDLYIDAAEREKLLQEISEMTGMTRHEIRFKKKDGTEITVADTKVPVRNQENDILYFDGFLEDITERKHAEEDVKQGLEKVHRALQGTIDAAAKMVELRDPYTAGHQQKVAKLAMAIAQEMNLSEEQIKYIGMAATVHDIGKINVPAEILSRTGKLTGLEFQMVKMHVQGSYDILKNIEFPWPIAEVVLQHHERMDGSGYPRGLNGDQIMLEARILALADTVEAMSSHRPYRPAPGVGEALEEISKNQEKLYDTNVVEACINLILGKGFRLDI